ncbi:MAG: hypothetical protein A3D44_03410 [Candidatus Staskawiczbacteria bacterium RIFCSPHIGHO2_02_FULL_42_22]|uniref:Uncharacterized protein n=1 Tax=Candidatus Staskawiczbacteria bacterium RIFCSPHIGHO2_02_FULL_42_22 TaxID=1802207 RepID=A0A1G2I473_9BACT|nr:MAG: hypothetical protein A3D44_03410 [Candidatus Staskawiczbacteria bacterium RIFCSPHIGHO2_02_FULL_42_22]
MVKEQKDHKERNEKYPETQKNEILETIKNGEVFDSKKELQSQEDINEKIRQEIESMELDDAQVAQTKNHANKINDLDNQKKIKNLLALAKKKGVIYSVKVAQAMNDPYILDTFHDMLAREGYYKKFMK